MLRDYCKRSKTFMFILSVVLGMVSVSSAAVLPALDAQVISDSEEPFDRRIYSYDMDVDAIGTIHIVYLKPTTGNVAEVRYARRASGVWTEQVLSSAGLRGSISTHLLVDSNNVVHLCYIKSDENLYYRTINNGVPGEEIEIQAGGWHTRMQLDENNRALFVRGRNGAVRKLDIVTTTDGVTWEQHYWDLPALEENLRLGGFVYADGVYHVIYGDSSLSKPVVGAVGDQTFHKLYYASSDDGVHWSDRLVDSSGTLYEHEFWTALLVDFGKPVVAMYKYAEYLGQYNTGTSALLALWDGSQWQKKNITPASYPATREGMGIGLVRNVNGDYFGGWDFSPDNTYDDDFRGARGNIVLARSGSGSWEDRWQVDEFSAEGEVKLRIRNNRLYYLALGDYIDAKLYFREYDMGLFVTPIPPPEASDKPVAPFLHLLLSE